MNNDVVLLILRQLNVADVARASRINKMFALVVKTNALLPLRGMDRNCYGKTILNQLKRVSRCYLPDSRVEIKTIVAGAAATGKSSMERWMFHEHFIPTPNYNPADSDGLCNSEGPGGYRKQFRVEGLPCPPMAAFCSTRLRADFETMRDLCLSQSHVMVLCVDGSRASIAEARELFKLWCELNPHPEYIVLALTRVDEPRQQLATSDDGRALAREFQAAYVECSAKLSLNMSALRDELFLLGACRLAADRIADLSAKKLSSQKQCLLQ